MNHAEATEEVAEQAFGGWTTVEAPRRSSSPDHVAGARACDEDYSGHRRSTPPLGVRPGSRYPSVSIEHAHSPQTHNRRSVLQQLFQRQVIFSNEVLSTWRESSFVIGFSEEALRIILHIFLTYFAMHQQFILRACTHTTKQS